MEFKKVKNPNKPGRPPSKCVWVKDEEGNIVTNPKGELAFRPATAADLKAKAKKKAAKAAPAKKRGRKPAVAVVEEVVADKSLLLKRTYKDLPVSDLLKIRDIVESLVEGAKQKELDRLQKEKEAIEKKLAALS